MKALTVHAPWGWAIAHAQKDTENRTWHPPRSLIGQRIAIHQGLKFDGAGLCWIENLLYEMGNPNLPVAPPVGQYALGAIVATAVVAGSFELENPWDGASHERSQWACGPVCWQLEHVVALPEPIPHKGAQGLWQVTTAALERIPPHAR